MAPGQNTRPRSARRTWKTARERTGPRLRPDDPFAEAYWRAYYRLVGRASGETLKSALLRRGEETEDPEWKRVHERLLTVNRWLALAIHREAMAETAASRRKRESSGPGPP